MFTPLLFLNDQLNAGLTARSENEILLHENSSFLPSETEGSYGTAVFLDREAGLFTIYSQLPSYYPGKLWTRTSFRDARTHELLSVWIDSTKHFMSLGENGLSQTTSWDLEIATKLHNLGFPVELVQVTTPQYALEQRSNALGIAIDSRGYVGQQTLLHSLFASEASLSSFRSRFLPKRPNQENRLTNIGLYGSISYLLTDDDVAGKFLSVASDSAFLPTLESAQHCLGSYCKRLENQLFVESDGAHNLAFSSVSYRNLAKPNRF